MGWRRRKPDRWRERQQAFEVIGRDVATIGALIGAETVALRFLGSELVRVEARGRDGEPIPLRPPSPFVCSGGRAAKAARNLAQALGDAREIARRAEARAHGTGR